jgi:ribosomal protein S18 acetylase RimI-like enzyme
VNRRLSCVNDLAFSHHAASDAADMLDDLCAVYGDAYGHVPGEDSGVKTAAFRDRANAALGARNYELVTAQVGGEIVGFVFGYSLRPERDWWAGLTPQPAAGFADETGERTVVLAEIEVRKAWQGRGVGHRLHDEFLRGRHEERATLTANPVATATHALYERWGWQRVGVRPGGPTSYYREYVMFVLPLTGVAR